jgi:hypothetical protein
MVFELEIRPVGDNSICSSAVAGRALHVQVGQVFKLLAMVLFWAEVFVRWGGVDELGQGYSRHRRRRKLLIILNLAAGCATARTCGCINAAQSMARHPTC